MLVFILAGFFAERGIAEQPVTYVVAGVADGDSLNVRAGPGAKFAVVATLPNGAGGIIQRGHPVLNGNDDWIDISFASGEGWVRPKYLEKAAAVASDYPPDNSQSQAAPLSQTKIDASPQTLALWKSYEDIANQMRESEAKDGAVELSQIQLLDPAGADPIVVSFIENTKAYLRFVIAGSAQAEQAMRQVRPARELVATLRPFAEKTGEELMPDAGGSEDLRKGVGGEIGSLLLDYVFSDLTAAKNMPDGWRAIQEGDRLKTEESLINGALGLEDSDSLKLWLDMVRNRSFAANLLRGHWVCRNVNGKTAELVFSSDPRSYLRACGKVEMHWRSNRNFGGYNGAPQEISYFVWQFVKGSFRMTETDVISMFGGPQVWRSLNAKFTSPDVFDVSDEQNVPIGQWTRIDDASR